MGISGALRYVQGEGRHPMTNELLKLAPGQKSRATLIGGTGFGFDVKTANDAEICRRVMERIKNDIATRHIPICIISTDDSRDQSFVAGALAFVAKPIQKREVLDNLLGTLNDFANRKKKVR